jgi:hypothetical protein
MKLFTDKDLRDYVAGEVRMALENKRELHTRELQEKQWEINRLTAQLKDAELARDRFRGGYKRALVKLAKRRVQLAQASRQLVAAGLAAGEEPNEDGSPKLDTVQGIFDAVMSKLPMLDDMSQKAVTSYIERELRARGPKAGPDIASEAIEGDSIED